MPVHSWLTIASVTEGMQRKSSHLLTVKFLFVLLYAKVFRDFCVFITIVYFGPVLD